MGKTSDVLGIMDVEFGDDPEYGRLLEDERARLDIARVILNARTAAGLTQKELADRIGTRQSAIARLEDADYHGHSLRMLERIAAALGQRVEVRFAPLTAGPPEEAVA